MASFQAIATFFSQLREARVEDPNRKLRWEINTIPEPGQERETPTQGDVLDYLTLVDGSNARRHGLYIRASLSSSEVDQMRESTDLGSRANYLVMKLV
tara:strand:- start:638 stop:931 length:294 start_codon:yes stop_codon:yes gene_type:complete